MVWHEVGKGLIQDNATTLYRIYAGYFRVNPDIIYNASYEKGGVERISLTLSIICLLLAESVIIFFVNEFIPYENYLKPIRHGIALAASTAALSIPSYLALKPFVKKPFFIYFINISLVAVTLILLIPNIIILLGTISSPMFGNDVQRFKVGRATGTPLHSAICGNLADRRDLINNSIVLQNNSKEILEMTNLIQDNTNALWRQAQRMSKIIRETKSYSGDRAGYDALIYEGAKTFAEGEAIRNEGERLQRINMDLMKRNIDDINDGLDIQERMSSSYLKLMSGYPLLGTFVVVGAASGLVIWLMAAANVWRFALPLQPTKRRVIAVGGIIVILFVLTMGAVAAVSSGIVEVVVSPTRTMPALIAGLRHDAEALEVMCGQLDPMGLW